MSEVKKELLENKRTNFSFRVLWVEELIRLVEEKKLAQVQVNAISDISSLCDKYDFWKFAGRKSAVQFLSNASVPEYVELLDLFGESSRVSELLNVVMEIWDIDRGEFPNAGLYRKVELAIAVIVWRQYKELIGSSIETKTGTIWIPGIQNSSWEAILVSFKELMKSIEGSTGVKAGGSDK